MKSLERRYDARITEVYRNGQPGAGGTRGALSEVTYDAVAVNTGDVIPMSNVSPFRRLFFPMGTADEPQGVAASVGDDCSIAMCQGQARLTDVPEQYEIDECQSGLL